MATLDLVKRTALADPEVFVRDLTAGRIRVEGGGLLAPGASAAGGEEDSSSDSDGDSEEGDKPNQRNKKETQSAEKNSGMRMDHLGTNLGPSGAPPTQQWEPIPKPQNIVRCPPINWSQYAVVGESLEKLHNEQIRRPSRGAPAVLTPDGRFEFKGGGSVSEGKQEQYLGVAAPYAPGKDKVIDGKSGTTALKR